MLKWQTLETFENQLTKSETTKKRIWLLTFKWLK